jgi:hypothetical protein
VSPDLHNGLIERFRSLVMACSAVLADRVLADALRDLFAIVLMLGVGYLVGFRLHTGAPAIVAAIGVLLLFSFAISWVNALLGLAARSAEAAAAASLPLTVLLAFPSSAFLLTQNMPGPLRAYADHQPVTATINAVRSLVLGGSTISHVLVAIIGASALLPSSPPLRCSDTVGPPELPRRRAGRLCGRACVPAERRSQAGDGRGAGLDRLGGSVRRRGCEQDEPADASPGELRGLPVPPCHHVRR